MGKVPKTPHKVYTPGSAPNRKDEKKKGGRPKKQVMRKGTVRKGNYRSKYNEEALKKALLEVKAKRLSIRAASEKYGIPRTTIGDHIHSRVTKKVGRPTELEEEEERVLADRLLCLAKWGFPLDSKDTRMLIKNYLDAQDRKSRFVDNMPGQDWLDGFLARHEELVMRRASLIKRSRAHVTREDITSFFEHYSKVAEGIPPQNIWNYDETNLSDNPG